VIFDAKHGAITRNSNVFLVLFKLCPYYLSDSDDVADDIARAVCVGSCVV